MVAAVGIASLVVALGFALEWPTVTALWPLPVTHLTYVFLAGIVLAFAAPVLWIAWTGELAALAGEGMTALVAFAGAAAILAGDPAAQSGHVVGFVVAAVLALGATLVALRRPFLGRRPTPPWVRAALAAFAVILLISGGIAAAGVPNILPWKIDGTNARLVGWIFIADAAYFAYGVVRPRWTNAAGQLLAFAAYDVLLLPPFADHLGSVIPEQRLSLVVYLFVLALSLAIAIAAFVTRPRAYPTATPDDARA
jgi:hypothetical protein